MPIRSLTVRREAAAELAKAANAAKKREYRAAVERLHKALEIEPKYFQASNNLGVCHYSLSEKEKAIEMLEKALTMNRDALIPHTNLARRFLELSRPEDAGRHLIRATELESTSAQAFYQLGRAYILLDRFSDSAVPLRRALELNPPVPHAHFCSPMSITEWGRGMARSSNSAAT